jgi:outer membrane protein assembly factor BamE (lipoprotein component of BamABCDE complex)
MIRSPVFAALALAMFFALSAMAQPARLPDPSRQEAPWRSPESWRQLRIGMSQGDVLRILGEPGKVTTYYAFERWEYPDALGQRVDFDERGRLSVWGILAR